MIKKRTQPTKEQIESFANAADTVKISNEHAPNAPKDFKAIRVPFNEYEYRILEKVALKTGRSKLNTIRWAILKLAEES